MKNKIIFSALLFLFPLLTSATSGACSGHGGVSCAAGPDRDGSVICVDGWTNSSVQYSSMVKCQGYTQPQTISQPVSRPVQTKPVEPIQKPKPASVTPVKTVIPTKIPTTTPTTTVQTSIESTPQPQVIEIPQKPAKKSFWSRVLSWF